MAYYFPPNRKTNYPLKKKIQLNCRCSWHLFDKYQNFFHYLDDETISFSVVVSKACYSLFPLQFYPCFLRAGVFPELFSCSPVFSTEVSSACLLTSYQAIYQPCWNIKYLRILASKISLLHPSPIPGWNIILFWLMLIIIDLLNIEHFRESWAKEKTECFGFLHIELFSKWSRGIPLAWLFPY